MKNNIATHNSFIDFYTNESKNFKSPRIDGDKKGGNRGIAGQFKYNGKTWKVHMDSHVAPLKNAFDKFKENPDAEVFKQSITKGGKGKCLVLNPNIFGIIKIKNLYIYEVKQ